MQDDSSSNPAGNEARQPPGRTPAAGSDSGDAQVPGGGTGNRGVGGIGTAGGTNDGSSAVDPAGKPSTQSASGKGTDAKGDPNDVGPAGDYSR